MSPSRKNRRRRIRIAVRRSPRTADEFYALTDRFQERWTRVTHVISKMRADRVSLHQAAREFGLDPRVVRRLAHSALRKHPNGRYTARPADRLLRVLIALTPKGKREVAVRDSRQASLLGEYWATVRKYLATGDSSGIGRFRRKRITDANGKRIQLLTDLDELDVLGSAGVLSFESLYAGVA